MTGYHKKNLREKLLDVAEQSIRADGVSALSLRKLAKSTGVSTMATYHHFANKDEIFVQVAILGYQHLMREIASQSDDANSPEDEIRAVARGYIKFALNEPNLYQLVFGHHIRGKALFPELKKAGQDAFAIFASVIQKNLEADGQDNIDRNAVGITFWATLHGLVSLVQDGVIFYHSKTEDKIELLINQAVSTLLVHK